VTAEGIETEEQLRQLVALKCDLGQGFWLNAPLDGETVAGLLAAGIPYHIPRRSHGRRAKAA
jgi:EAL domain-containing protein (putative c-di-GMP-specific phosphodiesterase class I)